MGIYGDKYMKVFKMLIGFLIVPFIVIFCCWFIDVLSIIARLAILIIFSKIMKDFLRIDNTNEYSISGQDLYITRFQRKVTGSVLVMKIYYFFKRKVECLFIDIWQPI